MKRKTIKKLKRIFSPYNVAIVGAIIIILISLFVIFNSGTETKEQKTVDGLKVIETNKKETEETTEDEARKIAVKQFKQIGEDISESDLKVTTIVRNGEDYYYISSYENTLEIKVIGGNITRLNSVVVK